MTLKVSTTTGTVCAVCSASSLAKRFYCKKNLRILRLIFLLTIYECSCLYRLERRLRVTACDVCYTSVNPCAAMVLLRKYVAIKERGGKITPRCISCSVPVRSKISTTVPTFSGQHILFVSMPIFTGVFFPKI